MLDERHGPLPLYLLAMTVVTGLVDAASYLGLGHVFVANMTGNVVFLGFAAAQVSGFSIVASAIAVVAFMLGAACGGAISDSRGKHRGYVFWVATGLESLLAAIAAVVSFEHGYASPWLTNALIIAALALAMGLQNSIARRLAVPDLTTTVLTLTITGIASDRGESSGSLVRRLASITCMFIGAAVGGALMLWYGLTATLVAAFALLLFVFLAAFPVRYATAGWVNVK